MVWCPGKTVGCRSLYGLETPRPCRALLRASHLLARCANPDWESASYSPRQQKARSKNLGCLGNIGDLVWLNRARHVANYVPWVVLVGLSGRPGRAFCLIGRYRVAASSHEVYHSTTGAAGRSAPGLLSATGYPPERKMSAPRSTRATSGRRGCYVVAPWQAGPIGLGSKSGRMGS